MLICRNAERVHGQRKVGNPCSKELHLAVCLKSTDLLKIVEEVSSVLLQAFL